MLSPFELARVAWLQPDLRAIVEPFVRDVESATGKRVTIPPRGGVRSRADQIDLYNDRANNPYPVAQPGMSRHEYGGAIDINIQGGTQQDYDIAAEIADLKYFLDAGTFFPQRDKVHFQLRQSLADAQQAYAAMSQRRTYAFLGGLFVVGILLFTSSEE